MSIWFEHEVTFDEFEKRYEELVEMERSGNLEDGSWDGYELESLRNVWDDLSKGERQYGGTFYSASGFVDYIAEFIEQNYIPSGDWSEWPWRHLDVQQAAKEAEGDYKAYGIRTSAWHSPQRWIWVPN